MTKTVMARNEIEVLRHLSARAAASSESAIAQISEICSQVDIGNDDEVLRALYILEGKSLVQPEPAGDFTSHFWKITDVGRRAVAALS